MIDHVSVKVRDIAASRPLYEAALAALGHKVLMDITREMGVGYVGYGLGSERPQVWVGQASEDEIKSGHVGKTHLALTAPDRAAVDAFHAAGLKAGAADNGPPGPRPHYGPTYYAAVLVDADGHNLEAVCR